MQQALFGGGCFWCVEAVFLQIRGVEKSNEWLCWWAHD